MARRRHAPTEARDRALAALRAKPGVTLTEIAKVAKVSRSTAANAARELAAEARKAARKSARKAARGNPEAGTDRPPPAARAAIPQGRARPWLQAGERHRGRGRQGPHRRDSAGS